MKPCIALFLLSFISNIFFAQNKDFDTLHLNQIYENVGQLLISEKIIEVDSTPQSLLLERFENWGGETFRDYEKVRTSKTESQVTMTYISKGRYINLVAKFKENKVKVSVFDDGNTYKSGTEYSKPTQARSYYFKDKFNLNNENAGMFIYKTKIGLFNYSKIYADEMIDYKEYVNNTILTIEKSLKNDTKKAKSDDW